MKFLNAKQFKILSRAKRNGGAIVAGYSAHKGHLEYTNGSTLRALARRGLVTLVLSPDGNMMARLTPAGKVLA